MKVIVRLIIVVIMMFTLLIGCNTTNEMDNKITDDKGKQSEEKVAIQGDEVMLLVNKAFDRFWRVTYGDYNSGENARFVQDGIMYIYYSEDIDTKEDMKNFLDEVYTEEITSKILNNENIKEDENKRLYHPDGGIGTLYNWQKAKIEQMKEENNQRIYKFKIPEGDMYSYQEVELIYVDGLWKVNTVLHY